MIFFFFQAEDGIRDLTVTGVQTCALPICADEISPASNAAPRWRLEISRQRHPPVGTALLGTDDIGGGVAGGVLKLSGGGGGEGGGGEKGRVPGGAGGVKKKKMKGGGSSI